MWDHIKNRGDHGAECWALDWIQFLPAKRESRRYIGAHVLTQCDIDAGGHFDDIVAYGGWPMDDHDSAGFWSARCGRPSTVFHPTPSPYGIPLRSLYSKAVPNLLFAGRCASCTHLAMSSTRVMGTAASMGQAAGTVAAIALARGRALGDFDAVDIRCTQQLLLRDDAYLPGIRQDFSSLTQHARLEASSGDPEPLRDGINRPVGNVSHAWECRVDDWVAYHFDSPQFVTELSVTFDSALDRLLCMSELQADDQMTEIPGQMVRSLRVDLFDGEHWGTLRTVRANHQRFVRLPVHARTQGVRLAIDSTWGTPQTRLYAFHVE